jgi:23S rRNA pseudouridine1911/1915/1917 synthase
MQHIGHPVMADPIYGSGFRSAAARLDAGARAALDAMPGQALHAGVLGFVHPVTGRELELRAPVPDAFRTLLEALRTPRAASNRTTKAEPGRRMRRKPVA